MRRLLATLQTGRLTKRLDDLLALPASSPGIPLLRPERLSGEVRAALVALCPSGAFAEDGGEFRLDLAACVACGRCLRRHPDAIGEWRTLDVAVTRRDDLVQRVDLARGTLIEPSDPPPSRPELHLPTLGCRAVSAGNGGLDDSEIALAGNPYHDMSRFGFTLVASPRHADALLVTGPVSENMLPPLERTYHAMAAPKAVVAVGNEAIAGELFAGSPCVRGGVDRVLDVDVYVPGSPARPASILFGLLLLVGRVRQTLVGGQPRSQRPAPPRP